MRRIHLLPILAICALPLLSACGPNSDSSATGTTTAATSSAALPPTTASVGQTSAAAPTTQSAVAAGVNFTMPNMVGKVLQDAQDGMQSLGVMVSKSHDLLGVRHQVLDRDWKVCDQNVPAGQQVTGNVEGQIDFGVVKLSETCP